MPSLPFAKERRKLMGSTHSRGDGGATERGADKPTDRKGADLLLSLAATAAEHQASSLDSKHAATPSPVVVNEKNIEERSTLRKSPTNGRLLMSVHKELHPSPTRLGANRPGTATLEKRQTSVTSRASSGGKRSVADAEVSASKKVRLETQREGEETAGSIAESDIDSNRIISPASSNDGSKEETPVAEANKDYATGAPSARLLGHASMHPYPPPAMPTLSPYGASVGHGPPPGPGFPPRGYFPHPAYYHSAMPPHHHPAMYQHMPPPYMGPPATYHPHQALHSREPAPEEATPTTLKLDDGDWQGKTIGEPGGPVSNHRCIPRRNLYPPSDWADQCEQADDIAMPEFRLLMNFPEYATTRHGGSGEKHCVMCGKLRQCSTSAAAARPKKSAADDESTHIIPRQNKGVCTSCDVTVWTVTEEQLEIKWCKGCKNFRPWPCFGDKVLATKCVRCRDRQREKYAARKGQTHRPSSRDKEIDDHHLAAADGLRFLMRATERER